MKEAPRFPIFYSVRPESSWLVYIVRRNSDEDEIFVFGLRARLTLQSSIRPDGAAGREDEIAEAEDMAREWLEAHPQAASCLATM